MVAQLNSLFKASILLALLIAQTVTIVEAVVPVNLLAPTCSKIECPNYDVIHATDGYEIRRYRSAVWISTDPIVDVSFVDATRTGFLQLFNYIQGKNVYNQQINMTAPVLTKVIPSDGPFCESRFSVSFYVPAINQADPPPAESLHVDKWGSSAYAAVKQFSGFASDSDVGKQAASLQASLEGSVWAAAIEKSSGALSLYTVAQYNSPFEFKGRVNEIWMMFDMEGGHSASF